MVRRHTRIWVTFGFADEMDDYERDAVATYSRQSRRKRWMGRGEGRQDSTGDFHDPVVPKGTRWFSPASGSICEGCVSDCRIFRVTFMK